MRYFYDCEFDDNGKTIELISIGVVTEDGREFYGVSTEFDPEKCNDWVKANVLPKLPSRGAEPWRDPWKNKQEIADYLKVFLLPHVVTNHDGKFGKCNGCGLQATSVEVPMFRQPVWLIDLCTAHDAGVPLGQGHCPKAPEPELWGYYSDYDHVALCQLYGPMVALPKGFPFYTFDVNQWRRQLGLKREDLPPDPTNEHDALEDARWTKAAWEACNAVSWQKL